MKPSLNSTMQMVKKELFMYPEIKQLIAKFNDPFKIIVRKNYCYVTNAKNDIDNKFSKQI